MSQFYQKINTLWKRDAKNCIVMGDFSLPEFEYLRDVQWLAEEKIDGTNMSYDIYFSETGEVIKYDIHGKTETANIPAKLVTEMTNLYVVFSEKLTDVFRQTRTASDGSVTYSWPTKVTIFGEGYGGKIQGGGRYSKTEKFIVFDVTVTNSNGEEFYLLRHNVEDICNKLGLDIVTSYGLMTIREAELMIENIAYLVYTNRLKDVEASNCSAFSNHSEDKTLVIEGFVMKSPVGLKSRSGKPLVTKIKVKDYVDLLRKK